MKSQFVLLLCIFLIGSGYSQQPPVLPPAIRDLLNQLNGTFEWQMLRPSDKAILQTGSRTTSYKLDSLVLYSEELFDERPAKQVGLFGYNPIDSLFFAVDIFNVDMGPHLAKGRWDPSLNRIEFAENDASRYYLNFIDSDTYQWTYDFRDENGLKVRELLIVLKRIRN